MRPICDRPVKSGFRQSGQPVWFTEEMQVVVLSDTHLRDEGTRHLPPLACDALSIRTTLTGCTLWTSGRRASSSAACWDSVAENPLTSSR